MTSTQQRSIRAAIVQAEVVAGLDAALGATATLVADARARGAQLVVFPETWLPGYPAWLDVCRDVALWDHAAVKHVYRRMADESVAVPSAASRELARIARDAAVVLVVGVTERVDDGPGQGTLFNAVLTFDTDGRLINHHRKLVPTFTERMVWGGGDAEGLRACATAVGRIGALVCWEHWMPLARQALHESGEDIHAALWPTAHEMMQVASRHYAFEGRCFVLAAGSLMRASALPPELEPHPSKVGDRDQWVLRGGSAIIGPDGAYLSGPTFDAPAIVIADLDLGRIREERMTLDVSGHYHRPDVLELRVTRRASRPANE
ncbi:MAG: carbon-nitrogen hydrolase family protein [Gemmatimonadaceae bacterium]